MNGITAAKKRSSAMMEQEPTKDAKDEEEGSTPGGRGGAGTYIEGELGAFYLLHYCSWVVKRTACRTPRSIGFNFKARARGILLTI